MPWLKCHSAQVACGGPQFGLGAVPQGVGPDCVSKLDFDRGRPGPISAIASVG